MSDFGRQDLDWLVTDFTARVADVAHAVVISADGVPLALSDGIPAQHAEQLSAITAGLTSLMQGAARVFEGGEAIQALVEMEAGLMLIKAISDGSSLAILAVTPVRHGPCLLRDDAARRGGRRSAHATGTTGNMRASLQAILSHLAHGGHGAAFPRHGAYFRYPADNQA